MSDAIAFKKIEVAGRINLGHELELTQEPLRAQQQEPRPMAVVSGPNGEFDTIAMKADHSMGQAYASRLSDGSLGPLEIKDKGLVTSFGIFGAPGCGKTRLLMHLLGQVLAHEPNRKERQYGALILDPKASLADEVQELARRAKREKDVVIINTDYLTRNGGVNVIDCTLDPYELGAILVLAGRSAGIDASDPFWFLEWTNLFAASLSVLRKVEELRNPKNPEGVTLSKLLRAIFQEMPEVVDAGNRKRKKRRIEHLAEIVVNQPSGLTPQEYEDLSTDLQELRRFFQQDRVGTIEAFITKAFGIFRRSRLRCYSDPIRRADRPFYEDILEHGKIVVVSISPSEPVLAKTLCTLIKCLFQRTVLGRWELIASKRITNGVRPVVLACDEYSQIASEVPGEPMGDGAFLSLAREYGCLALLATQSVNVLQASSLKENWRAVFSNFAAKIYMRLVDNETSEEATKLAGESDWRVLNDSTTRSRNGSDVGRQRDWRERKNLPSTVLTQVLQIAQGVVVGSLDGGKTSGTYFLKVPNQPEVKGHA